MKLQTIRNEIVEHKCRADLIKPGFENLWVQVEFSLRNIARCVSGDEEQLTKAKISELKKKILNVSTYQTEKRRLSKHLRLVTRRKCQPCMRSKIERRKA